MTAMTMDPDTGPTALQWLLIELDRLPGCSRTKARVHDLLRALVGQRVHMARRDLVLPQRRRLARALIDAGYTAQQARGELVARCGFSRDSAERLVTAALTERAEQGIRERAVALQAQLPLFDQAATDESD